MPPDQIDEAIRKRTFRVSILSGGAILISTWAVDRLGYPLGTLISQSMSMTSLISSKFAALTAYAKEHPKKAAFALLSLLFLYRKLRAQARKSVNGKVVLITGGGSGLGRNLALRFAGLGARVVLWDLNEQALHAVGTEIAAAKGYCWTFSCDVTNRAMVYATAERVFREVGKVDILINNAGIVSGDWITDIPESKVERTFHVNVISHFWTIKAFLPEMLKANSGHIVTIASAAGLGGAAKLTDYCASKFAAVGLDESLRVELERRGYDGVKTTCICPYYINTGMFDGVVTRFAWLLPILSEDYASKRILESILTNRAYLVMPRLLYLIPLLRFLLPTTLFDAVSNILGTNHSMDRFKGRNVVPPLTGPLPASAGGAPAPNALPAGRTGHH